MLHINRAARQEKEKSSQTPRLGMRSYTNDTIETHASATNDTPAPPDFNAMGSNGKQWKAMGSNGKQWLESNGKQWKAMASVTFDFCNLEGGNHKPNSQSRR